MLQISGLAARRLGCLAGMVGMLSMGTSWAAVPKEPASALDQKEFFRPDLYISTANVPLQDALIQLPNRAAWESFLQRRAGSARGGRVIAFIDPRSGAATNLVGSFPLIPGDGVGNSVTLSDLARRLGRPVRAVDSEVVADAVKRFVEEHADVLGIDVAQLGAVRARPSNPDLWHVRIPQSLNGIPVRHGQLVAAISHGNVVTIGTEAWGDVRIDAAPRVSAAQALDAGFAYADGRTADDVMLSEPSLLVIPFAPAELQEGEGYGGPIGSGYGHRLAWAFRFQRPPDLAQWEVLVDAHTGDVLAFEDKNQYIVKQATGGVYPLTNTEVCPTPQTCGTMQLGWPMPFANTGLAAPNNFTNSAGIFDYISGTATSTLVGRFVRINDNCGAISLSSPTGDLAFGGANGQHDCVTPGVGGPGNTASSRSCFYEVNKIIEQAKGYLPANTWLQGVLQANVNIVATCNATYNGQINFFRSGGGCRNTGEIAAVFDHEWGHGMDDNDTGGGLSNSSEGYADIAAIYRLQASCVGHGFFLPPAGACGLTLDGTGRNQDEDQTAGLHCDTDCSGVRDADWAKHNPNTPDTALGFVCSACNTGPGPCGRQVHCAAAPSRQAAWDLVARDLVAPPFNMSSQSAFIVGNKLFYQGSGLIGSWHACTCGGTSDGCGATNAYMQWLTADDNDGNLNNGTPHMTALFAAFNRHGIACATPAPTNSGCAGGPSAAASLNGTPGNGQVSLSWNTVPGATRYWVYRTEGHAGCDFGKALIAEVTGTTYVDTQVANGRPYSYNVVAAGASAACFGPASNCVTVTPVAVADYSLSCNPAALTILQGGNGTSTCSVQSVLGFSASVGLSCTGLPAGTTCAFNPPAVTPPPDGVASSTLTVTVGAATPAGTYNFQAQGASGAHEPHVQHGADRERPVGGPRRADRGCGRERRLPARRNGRHDAHLEEQRDGADHVDRSDVRLHGPSGGDVQQPRRQRELRDDRRCRPGPVHGLLHRERHHRHPSPHPLGQHDPGDRVSDLDHQDVDAAHRGQLHRRAARERLLPVRRDDPPQERDRRLHRDNLLPGQLHDPRADGRVRARVQGAARLSPRRPACPPNMFNDVPETSPFCRWIEELANRGVVTGCGAATCTARPAPPPASRWRSSSCARWTRRSTRRRASRRTCSRTSRRPAPSAAGSKSWPTAASSPAAAAATTAPTANVTREQMARLPRRHVRAHAVRAVGRRTVRGLPSGGPRLAGVPDDARPKRAPRGRRQLRGLERRSGRSPPLAADRQDPTGIRASKVPPEHDARAGRVSSLIVSEPLVPGTGVGNTLRWVDLGGRPADEGSMKDAAWSAITGYLQRHEGVLRVDLSELSGAAHRRLRAAATSSRCTPRAP